ncbi:MAG: PQQ-dependent sugar dehydrogenase [Acidimicrobiia bacterium]|nr:PQQ-dependent sugar dehydrogenase [Acidimicrobiia bacterium]
MRLMLLLMGLALLVLACSDTDVGEQVPVTLLPTETTAVSTTTTPPSPASPGDATPTTAATTTSTTTTTMPVGSIDDLTIEAVEFATGFNQPVLMLPAPGQSRLYVVEQPGLIWVIDADDDPNVFLDISDDVRLGSEQGLLGLAFSPEYAENDLFYIHYTARNGDTMIEEVNAASGMRSELLRVDQPAANHNGGMISFGPDGNLWIGLGDGGGANDQFGQGQRSDTLLGTMLRIVPESGQYSIPSGNLAGEVWAIGLRNPWRWAFDGDDLWIGDVGQNRIEEVDVVDWTDGSRNFGWSTMEGSECFGGGNCSSEGLVLPVYEYPHSEGCSITGGFVYRGAAMPELAGQYLFADYCEGWVRSVARDGIMREWLPADSFSAITSFGVDAAGEIYVVTAAGSLFRLQRAG